MDQVHQLLARPRAYYNIDGVGELGIGFMCLSYALLGWLQLHATKDSIWHQMLPFLLYVSVMVAIIHYGSRAIKNRITYRRTGFVDYRARDQYWTPLAMGAGFSAIFSAVLYLAMRRHWELSRQAALVGLVLAASYIPIARTLRWKWVVFSVIIAGSLAIAALPPDVAAAFANHTDLTPAIPARAIGAYWLTFVLYGSALLISGAISFWLYLRHTAKPAAEDQ